MFVDVFHRLEEACAGNQLRASSGTTAAQYVSTLPKLVAYLYRHPKKERLQKFANIRLNQVTGEKLNLAQEFNPATQALDVFYKLLDDDCPPFTADAYARITASELRLVGAIALAQNNSSATSNQTDKAQGAATIDMDFSSDHQITLPILRARYSQALTRASVQMIFHSNGNAPMETIYLVDLLKSIKELAGLDTLNPDHLISTHHFHSLDPPTLPTFNFILDGTGELCELEHYQIGDSYGLIGAILSVFGAISARSAVDLENAIKNVLSSIAPILAQQWLNLHSESSPVHRTQSLGTRSEAPCIPDLGDVEDKTLPRNWSKLNSSDEAREAVKTVFSQILRISAFAKLHRKKHGIGALHMIALRAFNHRAQSYHRRSVPLSVLKEDSNIVQYLVATFVNEIPPPCSTNPESSQLLQLLAFKEDGATAFIISEIVLSDLVRIILTAETCTDSVELLLGSLLLDVQSTSSVHLSSFKDQGEGFRQLLLIAERTEYRPAVAHCIFNIITKDIVPSFIQSSEGTQESASDLEAFLEAAAIVLEHPPSDDKRPLNLSSFHSKLLSLIEPLKAPSAAKFVSEHPLRNSPEEIARSNSVYDAQQQGVVNAFETLKPKAGTSGDN